MTVLKLRNSVYKRSYNKGEKTNHKTGDNIGNSYNPQRDHNQNI